MREERDYNVEREKEITMLREKRDSNVEREKVKMDARLKE